MTDYNWSAFTDAEFARLLRNSEGRNELERSMFIEAARRIDERAEAIRILAENEATE